MYKWERSTARPIAQGRSGRIFNVHCVSDGSGLNGEYIQKQFNTNKSVKSFLKELDCQRRAAEIGIAPIIRDFSATHKEGAFMVMDQCSYTLLQLIKEQQGLYVEQLAQIKSLYEGLDQLGIQHNDANIGNIMVINDGEYARLKLIDFGMATTVTGKTNDASWKLLRFRIQREVNTFTPPLLQQK